MVAEYNSSASLPNPLQEEAPPDIFQMIELGEDEDDAANNEAIQSTIQDIILNTENGTPSADDIQFASDWFGVTPDYFTNPGYGSNPLGLNFTGQTYSILSQLAYALDNNQNIGEWLVDYGKNLLMGEAQNAGLGMVYNNLSFIKNELSTLMNLGINFQEIPSGDLFNAFTAATNNVELLVNHFENVINNVDEMLTYVTEKLPEDIENMIDYVQYQFDAVEKFMDKLLSGDGFSFDKILENLPDEIMNGLMNLEIVQDIMRVPRMVMNTMTTISQAVASISISMPAKVTLKDLLKFTKVIKQIISIVRQVQSQLQGMYERVKMIYDNLKNGQYFQTALMLVQGSVRFIDIPIQFNTVYPNGNNWRTPGGHAHIEDNTPGKEQKTYMHPSGSSNNYDPQGNVTTKAAKTSQMSAGENIEHKAGKVYAITAETITLEASNIDIHDNGTGIISLSADSINMQADAAKGAVNIGGGSVNIVADPTAGVQITGGTGVTVDAGMGFLTLLSKNGIILDSPSIIIGGIVPGVTNFPASVVIASSGTGVAMTSPFGVNTIALTAAGATHLGTTITMTSAGPILLN